MRDAQGLALLADRAAARAATWLATRTLPGRVVGGEGHLDFVTAVDRTAEAMIVETLERAEPGATFVGEEATPNARAGSGLAWIIDPLDGTTNFLHGFPAWAVSIAAAVDGELVAGAVHHPAAFRHATAWKGGGAWSGGTRLRVSTLTEPARALIGTGFPFKYPGLLERYLPQFERVLGATAGVRRAGAAALDLLDVASGRFDAFWELMLAPWDTAAGTVLVREAGGVVTTLEGRALGIEPSGVVAGNPWMQEWLLRLLGGES